MKRNVYRNIALVTALFALVLLVMMGVSWVQMRQVTPLQTEVMETLTQLNESNTENAELAEQIRQLDLLSRKAYFTQETHLKIGAWILCAMAIVIGLSLRMYFKDTKNLPEKELDPIDEWMIKCNARRYIGYGMLGVGCLVLVFAVFTSGTLRGWINGMRDTLAANDSVAVDTTTTTLMAGTAVADSQKVDSALVAEAEEPTDSFPVPKLTSNAFRGNNSSGHSSARNIPTSWNLKSGKNILWQKSIPKHGYNSPVVNGRNIFLTGADKKS